MWLWTLPHTFHIILNLLAFTSRCACLSSGVWWKFPTDSTYKGGSCTTGTRLDVSKFTRWCYLWTVDSLWAPPDSCTALFWEPGFIYGLPSALLWALPKELSELLVFPTTHVLAYPFLCCSLLGLCFFWQTFPENTFLKGGYKNFLCTSTLVFMCVCTCMCKDLDSFVWYKMFTRLKLRVCIITLFMILQKSQYNSSTCHCCFFFNFMLQAVFY